MQANALSRSLSSAADASNNPPEDPGKIANADRFTGRSTDYDRYRMRYPAEEVLAILQDWCGLKPAQVVADVGAGTGMLSEVFLENGNRVIAIEPNAEMRSACEVLQARYPGLTVHNAAAEDTGLPARSVDMVSVGRAFHWFDQPRALEEFRRILRPGGWIVLVAAGRRKEDTAQAAAYEQLLTDYGTDYSYIRGGYRIHERMDELFAGGEFRQTQLHGEQLLTLDEVIGQTLSLSVAPLPGDPRHPAMLQALRDFYARFAVDGAVHAPTTCWVTCGRFPCKD